MTEHSILVNRNHQGCPRVGIFGMVDHTEVHQNDDREHIGLNIATLFFDAGLMIFIMLGYALSIFHTQSGWLP
jgi:hypothetical protein